MIDLLVWFLLGVIMATMFQMLRSIESPPDRVDWCKIFAAAYLIFCFIFAIALISYGRR